MPLFCLNYAILFDSPPVLQDVFGPVLYATVAEALYRSGRWPRALPPTTWIAPSQCFANAAPDGKNLLKFAVYTVAANSDDATSLGHDIRAGLCKLGRDHLSAGPIGGNFSVVSPKISDDSANASSWCRPLCFAPDGVAPSALERHQKLHTQLQFQTPVRIGRPLSECVSGHRFMDAEFFCPYVMLRGLVHRVEGLGLKSDSMACCEQLDVQLISSNLRWTEVGYGSPRSRKVFGGVVGTIDLKVMNRETVLILQIGALIGVGELYRMGFGRYSMVSRVAIVPEQRISMAR